MFKYLGTHRIKNLFIFQKAEHKKKNKVPGHKKAHIHICYLKQTTIKGKIKGYNNE